jgi:hypothetical protein
MPPVFYASQWAVCLALLKTSGAWAQEPAAPATTPGVDAELIPPPPAVRPDKSGYSILDPTPRALWRPMSPDRPDTTESAYTVDAGAFQIELSVFDYSRNGSEDAWAVMPLNLKLGLLNNVDIQIVVDPYVRVDDGERTRQGFGDLQVRTKINLWGNDGGPTAFAFMPFIQIPTASDEVGSSHVEGGLIVPFAMDLAQGVSLGLMFQTDFVYDPEDAAYDTEFVGTTVLGFDVTDELGLFLEGVGIVSTDPNTDFRGLLGLGATYGFTPDVQLDAGINIGLTGDADDINVFAGLTVRF